MHLHLILVVTHAAASLCVDNETTHTLLHGGIRREYILYIPKTLCRSVAHGDALPLVVAAHCFGCTAAVELATLKDVAAERGFIVVAPEGVAQSWNALECCGEALARGLDDVGFIASVVEAVQHRLPFIAKHATYATGFSNGGFMVSLLATSGASWLHGIAPLAGYVYRGYEHVRAPIPVFAFHSSDDTYVRPNGCSAWSSCTRLAEQCCCGIGADSKQCFSVESAFDEWARINLCFGNASSSSLRKWVPNDGFQCQAARGCAATTALCMVGGGVHHTAWARLSGSTVGVQSLVGLFFAKLACTSSVGNVWTEEKTAPAAKARCRCASGFGGPHCLTPQLNPAMQDRTAKDLASAAALLRTATALSAPAQAAPTLPRLASPRLQTALLRLLAVAGVVVVAIGGALVAWRHRRRAGAAPQR